MGNGQVDSFLKERGVINYQERHLPTWVSKIVYSLQQVFLIVKLCIIRKEMVDRLKQSPNLIKLVLIYD